MIFFFNLELVNRGCQTQATVSKYVQMGRNVATQTAVPGIHISTKNDYVIKSGDYRVSTEYRKLQIRAVSFHFKKFRTISETKMVWLRSPHKKKSSSNFILFIIGFLARESKNFKCT